MAKTDLDIAVELIEAARKLGAGSLQGVESRRILAIEIAKALKVSRLEALKEAK